MEEAERNLRQELEERLRFETLLSEVSAQFINLPADQIDSLIDDAQRRFCELLDIDLSAFWQWSAEAPGVLTLTHLYSLPGGPPRPEQIDAQEMFPWVFQKMMNGELLVLSTEDMPPEARKDQESRRYFGVKSSVVIPLSTGGGLPLGVLTFDTLKDERTWSPEVIRQLTLVAQIFSNAQARKESDRILRQSEARLNLAADSAEAGLWELDHSKNLFWVTARARKIFGYDSEEVISMERFEKSVHPADLDRVLEVIAKSFDSREPFSCEYRILSDSGRMKWIYSCGRPYGTSNNQPLRLMGASIDISIRKAFEAKILEREERLTAAVDVAALGFYEMNGDYRLKYMDERFKRFLGIAPEDEPRARDFWLAHIHPDDLPHLLALSRRLLEEGANTSEYEYRYLHPEDGMLWLHHLSRVFERNRAGRVTRVVGVMRDVTKRRQAEEFLKKTEEELRNNQRDLQRLAGKLISVKEEEMCRLSRELHDDLTQKLAVIAIEAGKLEQHMKTVEHDLPGDPVNRISVIKEQLISVSQDVHRISRQLHPAILNDLGLVRAIESECATFQLRENLDIVFRKRDVPDTIPIDISLCIYRIVQEGLKNIISHSRVTRCEVILRASENSIYLTVKDKGLGFDPEHVRHTAGLGLSSMRERVLLVRGDFSIDSRPGNGTAIYVSIPLRNVDP